MIGSKDKIYIPTRPARCTADNDYSEISHEDTNYKMVKCPDCNRQVKSYWESRYNGIRATCNVCETNWQES